MPPTPSPDHPRPHHLHHLIEEFRALPADSLMVLRAAGAAGRAPTTGSTTGRASRPDHAGLA
ncbi:hypothetical protein ABZ826_35180 [Streptomyces sp. NPDC047515]|uniref:hypothetical protein n=1 Tax=Streptomyces sp. NPDC047515 TaxID=3155380 RepID=UPI0033CF97F5